MNLPTIGHPEQDNAKLKKKGVSLCAFLDTSRPRKDGTFTVRIRLIYNRYPKYYTTTINVNSEQFLEIASNNPKGNNRNLKSIIFQMLREINDIILEMNDFSFDELEKKIKPKNNSNGNLVNDFYLRAISNYKRNNQLGTASNYELSLKSLLDFHGKERLSFDTISAQWLKDYERYMIEKKERSRTTVGIYLRPLRAIFNTAIEDKIIKADTYPFGRRKFQIPEPKSVKKTLDKDELKALFEFVPKTPFQEKAKDFFFFSYSCNGMNMKDIAFLQYRNINNDVLTFDREKTKNTNKSQSKVIVYLSDFASAVISKYGNPDKDPNNYIFSIVSRHDTPEQKRRLVQNFVRFVNQHLKALTKSLGFDQNISTYWARHSFATHALRSGASMEFISEALNHSDMKTTKNYIAGFADDKKREFSKKIMEF
jgi:integrase/recombinase XerD